YRGHGREFDYAWEERWIRDEGYLKIVPAAVSALLGQVRRAAGGRARLPYIPVTRVENYCASGSEAFRGATYAVASGACDIALALGCEKLKDTGYGGLPQRSRGALTRCIGRTCRRRGASPSLLPLIGRSTACRPPISSAR